jgi:predicted transposase/invertase (TIGR01784 family)
MYETDRVSDLLASERRGKILGRAEGLAEGESKGRDAEKLEIARKMKAAGRPLEEIMAFTDLSFETIENL